MRPFVKWVGGKRSILNKLISNSPDFNSIDTFIEPMVGGGVMTCWILKNTKIKNVIINDKNKVLMDTYKIIKENPKKLIQSLKGLETKYNSCSDDITRKDLYYSIRDEFNSDKKLPEHLIFLNKTCFNGLFRLNKKGMFNTPMGYYENPKICDEENIMELHMYFKRLTILNGDYDIIKDKCDDKTFVYIDPPYRPLNKTSLFTSYLDTDFKDEDQIKLKEFIDELNKKKTKVLLSNSDPKNTDINDNFFDELYKEYNIIRIDVPRFINSVGNKRNGVKELLIKNY